MTLCISNQYRSLGDGRPTAFCYSDSLLTTLGSKNCKIDAGAFLLSNAEIKHQTTKGIKIHIVSAVTNGRQSTRDFVFSIAGAVPLGLQSLIHLDSVFKTFYGNYSFEEYIERVERTLCEFWKDAWDKDIEYLITAADDDSQIKIIHIKGTVSNLEINEVQPEYELLFGVIGDSAEEAREKIKQETNSLMCAGIEIYSALDMACIRMIRRAVEDPNQIFIGGSIQSCLLRGGDAQYLTLDDGKHLMYRGVEYPKEYNKSINRAPSPSMDIAQDIYNPQINIQEIIEIIENLELYEDESTD